MQLFDDQGSVKQDFAEKTAASKEGRMLSILERCHVLFELTGKLALKAGVATPPGFQSQTSCFPGYTQSVRAKSKRRCTTPEALFSFMVKVSCGLNFCYAHTSPS